MKKAGRTGDGVGRREEEGGKVRDSRKRRALRENGDIRILVTGKINKLKKAMSSRRCGESERQGVDGTSRMQNNGMGSCLFVCVV